MANGNGQSVATRHPAETLSATGSIAMLIGRAFGIKDADTLVAMGVVIGLVPTTVTWTVSLFRRKNGAAPTA